MWGVSQRKKGHQHQKHQKQHHVPYSLTILINGTFLLIHGIASTLWAFQYVFLIIYFRSFLFLVIFSCPSETVPYLRNYCFRKFGLPFHLNISVFSSNLVCNNQIIMLFCMPPTIRRIGLHCKYVLLF